MDCNSNHSIFLRANGSLACWDDYGSLLTLQAFESVLDYGQDVYLGRTFDHIRNKLSQNEMPFPEFCTQCYCLAKHLEYNSSFSENKEILVLQVEPTIRCTLGCPGCMTPGERKTRISPPYDLDIAVLEKILCDLQRQHIQINTIDFQGHGEPLLNRNLCQMIQLAKRLFPTTKITMCTNAHGSYQPEYVSSGLDEIIFAIDGIDQPSYLPYRQNGDFQKAFKFMKDFAIQARQQEKPIKTIWKYILFTHNDEPEQLRRAQELAKEAEVTDLVFVITQLGPKSSRIFEAEQIPIIDNGVTVSVWNYLVDLQSIRQSIDEARNWCDKQEYAKAEECLQYSAMMVHRRFRYNTEESLIPEAYQEALYELFEVYERFSKHCGENKISELDTVNSIFNKAMRSKFKAQNTLIQQQAQEIQQQAQLIDRMESSLSWKITTPMRSIRNHPSVVHCLRHLQKFITPLYSVSQKDKV